ncbi:MAG: CehA/McbA family metallohydrolase [Anaerolineae bacterium]|nr:CehA/McbA family metallohydrolase [Anaerolineae bacterium]MDW8298731.1 CehA/McbA family metallohydrolase [Anaerolineae bacterium]
MGKADLHMHSTYSDGNQSVEAILAYVEHYTDLDVIAITDHDCIEGALRARDLATVRHMRVAVLVGAEISTRDGHLLALGVERLIAADLSMAETVAAVHQQGGVAVAAHPLSWWCPSASRAVLDALHGTLDGIEVINGSFAGIPTNAQLAALNEARYGFAACGGSDAHTLNAIGSACTYFHGHTVADLLSAIRARQTWAEGGLWSLSAFLQYGAFAVRQRVPMLRSA